MPDMEFVKNNPVNDQKIPEFKVSTALGSIFMYFNIQYSELYIFSCSTDLMLSDQVPPGTVSFSCRILANSPSSAPFFPLGWVRNHHSQALGFFPPSHPQHNLFLLWPNEKRDSSPQQTTFSTIIQRFTLEA